MDDRASESSNSYSLLYVYEYETYRARTLQILESTADEIHNRNLFYLFLRLRQQHCNLFFRPVRLHSVSSKPSITASQLRLLAICWKADLEGPNFQREDVHCISRIGNRTHSVEPCGPLHLPVPIISLWAPRLCDRHRFCSRFQELTYCGQKHSIGFYHASIHFIPGMITQE